MSRRVYSILFAALQLVLFDLSAGVRPSFAATMGVALVGGLAWYLLCEWCFP
jgi:hypothetical protein